MRCQEKNTEVRILITKGNSSGMLRWWLAMHRLGRRSEFRYVPMNLIRFDHSRRGSRAWTQFGTSGSPLDIDM